MKTQVRNRVYNILLGYIKLCTDKYVYNTTGERDGAGGKGEEWPKQCMHM
jgi:hypothetical protein